MRPYFSNEFLHTNLVVAATMGFTDHDHDYAVEYYASQYGIECDEAMMADDDALFWNEVYSKFEIESYGVNGL